ncbi:MAG TPA: hypothetical protein VIC85_22200 [Ktedonobacterales bacterium]|jgi:hypothetical protein
MAAIQNEAPEWTAPPNQEHQGNGGQEPASNVELELDQLLRQHIAQAIQPVLDEYQREMAAGQQPQQPASQAPPRTEKPPEHAEPSAASNTDSPDRATPSAEPSGPAGGALGGVLGGALGRALDVPSAQHLVPRLSGVVSPALDAVEQQGAQWIQSVLVGALTAVLAESSRAVIQRRAEQGLHALLTKAFDALPEGTGSEKARYQSEHTLQAILRDSLDVIFADPLRATMLAKGERALHDSLHGDLSGAAHEARDTAGEVVDALGEVLRHQRQRIIRLLFTLALLVLASSVEHSLTPTGGKSAKGKADEAKVTDETPAAERTTSAAAAEAKPAEDKPAEDKPADPEPTNGKPASTGSATANAANTKSGNGKSTTSKASATTSGKAKPASTKSGGPAAAHTKH